jgi:hypothetical protein
MPDVREFFVETWLGHEHRTFDSFQLSLLVSMVSLV